MTWEGLTPPYATIVADPPWSYGPLPSFTKGKHGGDRPERRGLPYTAMSIGTIAALPVEELAATNAHLYLWTTNRYLRDAYGITEAWGFRPSQVLAWCKEPMGISVGTFTSTTEFVLFARRGSLRASQRVNTTWWQWKRGRHSAKPPAFLDLVERVSPEPRVELFARAQRLGWDSWGWGYEQVGAV